MGYVRNAAGRWDQRFKPCDLVLFEDLSRYRMRTDRPRRENSQLMRWAHRAVPGEVKMQGELYGIGIADTSAAFSSRYHAGTLTPGIRCRMLSASDLDDEWLREDLARLGIDLATRRAGDLVPRDGGQFFACLRSQGGFLRIDADINAAQNLQRRYWTRHAEAFRLPCGPGQLDGKEVWVPRTLGPACLGGWVVPACYARPVTIPGPAAGNLPAPGGCRGLAVAGDDLAEAPADIEAEELSGLVEEAEIAAGKVVVFFRDPSGVIWPKGLWYPAKVFWNSVRQRTSAALEREAESRYPR